MAKHVDPASKQPTTPADVPPVDQNKNVSVGKRAASHAAEQAFLKLRKPIARWIAKNIPDPLKDRAKTWASAIPYISIALATLTPDLGIMKYVDDFQQDLFDAIEEELKHPSTAAEDLDVNTTAHLNTMASVMQAVDELPPADRQDFEEWFFDTPEHQVGFNRLVTGADKDKIKSLAVRSKPELERMIDHLKVAPKMTILDLRTVIDADPATEAKVNAFLVRLNTPTDRTLEFWKAVEVSAQKGRLTSLDQVKLLFGRSDPEILMYLDMRQETLGHQIQQKAQQIVSGLDKKLGRDPTGGPETGFLKKTGDWMDKAKKKAGF